MAVIAPTGYYGHFSNLWSKLNFQVSQIRKICRTWVNNYICRMKRIFPTLFAFASVLAAGATVVTYPAGRVWRPSMTLPSPCARAEASGSGGCLSGEGRRGPRHKTLRRNSLDGIFRFRRHCRSLRDIQQGRGRQCSCASSFLQHHAGGERRDSHLHAVAPVESVG